MDGIILIDKPAGPTSAGVVREIKARVRPARVGHLGTLDPFATGVLPILIGEGTKLAPFLQDGTKDYEGIIALGLETDTLDSTGEVVKRAAYAPIDDQLLKSVAARFIGTITQVPPVFSAIKRDGVPLYKRARRGEDVPPPPPRQVTIERLELTPSADGAIGFSLTCSTGTYVRALARDLGLALGTVAHLARLRRTRTGSFSVATARPLAAVLLELEAGSDPGFIGLREALPDWPEVAVDAAVERRLRNGDARALDFLAPAAARMFKVTNRGRLLAVAEAVSRTTATIARIFIEN